MERPTDPNRDAHPPEPGPDSPTPVANGRVVREALAAASVDAAWLADLTSLREAFPVPPSRW